MYQIEDSDEDEFSSPSELFEKVFADTSKEFRANSIKGPRRYSAPAIQNPALQRTNEQEPPRIPTRPHSAIMLNNSHHVYDVPKLRPQKAPILIRTGKPEIPPKEKRYSVS